MYSTTVSLSFILTLAISAAPTDPTHDTCGPATKNPTDPKDSCSTAPSISNSPIVFGVSSMGDNIPLNFDWTICGPVVTSVCNTMNKSITSYGEWHLETRVVALDYGNPACQMGFYHPAQTGSTQKPSLDQCKNVFSTMQPDAATARDWYGASINLRVNPATGAHQYSLPGGSGTVELLSHYESV